MKVVLVELSELLASDIERGHRAAVWRPCVVRGLRECQLVILISEAEQEVVGRFRATLSNTTGLPAYWCVGTLGPASCFPARWEALEAACGIFRISPHDVTVLTPDAAVRASFARRGVAGSSADAIVRGAGAGLRLVR